MTKTKRKKLPRQNQTKASAARHKQPLAEHLHELKRRVFYCIGAVLAGSIIAYAVERRLIEVLLHPSHGQQFIYTSPLGGMNFLFSVCLDIGLILATPVIVYNVLAFLKPLLGYTTHRFLLLLSIIATLVAAAGVVFGYFVGLPSALHFLLNQFVTVQVKPLLTIQAYVQFVAIYLLGSALMFQLPLLILLINRIKPLKPGTLLKYERHAVVGAFIVAFIMNPTPNLIDQLIVIVPIFIMYQVSIALIWFVNKRHRPGQFEQLLHADIQRQEARLQALIRASRLQLAGSLTLQMDNGLTTEVDDRGRFDRLQSNEPVAAQPAGRTVCQTGRPVNRRLVI